AATEVNWPAKYLWQLIQRPEASRAIVSNPTGIESEFLADVPGAYVLQLTVRTPSGSAMATLTVNPSCTTGPLTPVNTIDMVNGLPGMTVGTCFFAAPTSPQFQVVYLWRNGANGNSPLSAYTAKYATGSAAYAVTQAGINAMYSDFSALPTNG